DNPHRGNSVDSSQPALEFYCQHEASRHARSPSKGREGNKPRPLCRQLQSAARSRPTTSYVWQHVPWSSPKAVHGITAIRERHAARFGGGKRREVPLRVLLIRSWPAFDGAASVAVIETG